MHDLHSIIISGDLFLALESLTVEGETLERKIKKQQQIEIQGLEKYHSAQQIQQELQILRNLEEDKFAEDHIHVHQYESSKPKQLGSIRRTCKCKLSRKTSA